MTDRLPCVQRLSVLAVVLGITGACMSGVLACQEDDLATGLIFEDVQGVVLDSITLQPIDSAKITVFDTVATSTPYFTDTLGVFKFGIGGNGSPLFFRKSGYKTKFIRANKNDTLTVLLALEFRLLNGSGAPVN